MKLSGIPVSVFLILFVAAILVLNNPLSSILSCRNQFSSSYLLMFSLLNTIIFSIIIGSYKPYTNEVGQDLASLCYSHEVGDHAQDYIKGSSDEEDDFEEYHGSDGYEEDDDDNNDSDEEVGWEHEEGYDDNLQMRIEDFIAKVTNVWKEDRLRDRFYS
ncbi:hypothetical protein ACOSP7_025623 [Xanthoceras sorbifolium]